MKLLLISTDNDLKKELEATGYFERIDISDDVKAVSSTYNIIVISDKAVLFNDLTNTYDYYADYFKKQNVFYMLSNNYKQTIDNVSSVCKLKSIHVIQPKLSISEIIEEIIRTTFSNQRKKLNNVVLFMGADSKVGNTIVCQSIAEELSSKTSANICLIDLNNNPGVDYLNIKNNSLVGMDSLKIKLFNGILKHDELTEGCLKKGNLFVLKGPNSLVDIRQYHPEHIEKLLEIASEVFELIIVDAGTLRSLDSSGGLTIGALNSAAYNYLVTTQQINAFNEFKRVNEQIFRFININPEEFLIVINKYINDLSIPSAKDIADMYMMPLAATIPNMDILGWQAEYDNSTFLKYDNKLCNKCISELSRLIAGQVNIPYIDKTDNKGILTRIKSVLGGD